MIFCQGCRWWLCPVNSHRWSPLDPRRPGFAHLSETTNGYKWFLALSLGSNLGNIIILQLVCKCDNTSHLLSVYYPRQNVMEQLGYQTCLMSYPQRLMIPRNSRFSIFLGWPNTTNSQRRRCPIQFDTTGLRGWFLTLTGVQSESNSFAQFFRPPDVWPAGWPTGCYDQRAHTHTSTDPSWLTMSSMIMLTSSHGARWCTVRIPNQTSKPQNPSTGCGLAVGAPTYSSAYVYSFTSHFTSHLGWIKTYYGIPWHMGGWTSISLNSLILGETDAVSFFSLKWPWLGDQISNPIFGQTQVSMDYDHSVAIPLKPLQCGAPER